MIDIKTLSVILSVLLFLIVIELARRDKLSFKYALGWMILSLTAVFFGIFDKVLFELSQWFGFELPSNFIFFVLLGMFVFLSLFLTIFLSQQNSRNDIMAQKISLLEFELKKIKEKEFGGSRNQDKDER